MMKNVIGTNPLVEIRRVAIKNNSMTETINVAGIVLKPKAAVIALVQPGVWGVLKRFQRKGQALKISVTIQSVYNVRQNQIKMRRPVEILGRGVTEEMFLGRNVLPIENKVEEVKTPEIKEEEVTKEEVVTEVEKTVTEEEIPLTEENKTEEVVTDKNNEGKISFDEIKNLKGSALKEYAVSILGESVYDMSRKEIINALKGKI